jgi:virginiamycin A acetyltransferase
MNTDSLQLGERVSISDTARIYPSNRGTKIYIGNNCEIYDYVVIRCVGGTGDIIIGQNNFLNPGCVLYSGNGITTGNYVLFGPGVKVVPTNHNFSRHDIPIRLQGFAPSKGGVIIEDDVWIGANTVILDGATIRKGAIVGAGSLVRGEIPANQIWGGNPARFLSDRRKNNA